MHAEIAGAGFAGLTAAIGLKQRGWSVRVHEASSELRAFGAGIFMWQNGLQVLKAIGAYDDIMAGSHHGQIRESRINGQSISQQAFDVASGAQMVTMTRQRLYDAVLAAARRHDIEILTNSEVVGAEARGVLRTASGAYEADLVIGADGVRSQVRDSLQIPTERKVYNDGVIRLLVDWEDPLPQNLDHVIDFWNLEPRLLRALFVPCGSGEIYLCLMAPRTDEEAAAIPVNKPIWMKGFPEIAHIIDRIGDQGRYDSYETTTLERWSEGKVAIIGDAAHAMPPTLGQGCGCAMMNALSLAVALQEESDIEKALLAWEKLERPLTDHTQDHAAGIAQSRKGAKGQPWDPEALRAARHIPRGTSSAPSRRPEMAGD